MVRDNAAANALRPRHLTVIRVCIDYSSAIAHAAGVSRYVRDLTHALAARTGDVALTLVHNRPGQFKPNQAHPSLPSVSLKYGIRSWRAAMLGGGRLFGNAITSRMDFDVYHGPDCIAPATGKPTVLTIHDLTVLSHPQFHSKPNRVFMRLALPTMVRRATVIIADSESTRREVIKRLGVHRDTLTVIYPGINHERFHQVAPAAAARQVASALKIDKPYVLALGTLEPRKNLITLLRAFAGTIRDHECQLVLAGSPGWGRNELENTVAALGLASRVHITGYVADELLASLYSAAMTFVYPSWFEGFGFPVLEAMACGTPVICSNTSSIPEIAGDAALLCHPGDAATMGAQLRELAANPDQRRIMGERGLRQAAKFRWSRAADETIQTYYRAAGRNPR